MISDDGLFVSIMKTLLKTFCLQNDGLEYNVLKISELIRYIPEIIRQITFSHDRDLLDIAP